VLLFKLVCYLLPPDFCSRKYQCSRINRRIRISQESSKSSKSSIWS